MRVVSLLGCIALVAGCHGDGNKGSSTQNPPGAGPPAAKQSAGGIWAGIPGAGESMTFYIAETGELVVQTTVPSGGAFGKGAVIVNSPNDVAGTYELFPFGIFNAPPPVPPPVPLNQTCTIDGTVTERSVLLVDLSCTDPAGITTNRSVSLLYLPAYDVDSALADIAGNYTLPFNPQTNSLNLNANGVVFGMLNNGANCTVNGQVQIIDARFNLYRFEMQLSLCLGTDPQRHEGATYRGFAMRNLPGMRAGAFFLLVSSTATVVPGVIPPIRFFSLVYDPV